MTDAGDSYWGPEWKEKQEDKKVAQGQEDGMTQLPQNHSYKEALATV